MQHKEKYYQSLDFWYNIINYFHQTSFPLCTLPFINNDINFHNLPWDSYTQTRKESSSHRSCHQKQTSSNDNSLIHRPTDVINSSSARGRLIFHAYLLGLLLIRHETCDTGCGRFDNLADPWLMDLLSVESNAPGPVIPFWPSWPALTKTLP